MLELSILQKILKNIMCNNNNNNLYYLDLIIIIIYWA